MQHTEIGDADMGFCVPVYCEGIIKLPQMDLDRLVHGGSLFDEHIIQSFSASFYFGFAYAGRQLYDHRVCHVTHMKPGHTAGRSPLEVVIVILQKLGHI